MKPALLVAMAVLLGSCHDAPPPTVAPATETTGPVILDEPTAWSPGPEAILPGGAAGYPTDTPIAMP